MKDKTHFRIVFILIIIANINASKEEIDKELSSKLSINMTDSTSENCGKLFNKIYDIGCLEMNQMQTQLNQTTKASKHYYIFVIVSKVESKYYEYYFGTCLNFNESIVTKYVDEDYLMENSGNKIINSQITGIKEINQMKNITPASITIIVIIAAYIFFCFFTWYKPSRSSILENNEYELKANKSISNESSQFSNESQDIQLLNNSEGLEKELKRKHFFDELYNSFNPIRNFSDVFVTTSSIRNKEIRILMGLRSVSYFITMMYTCAPVLFKLPISNPNWLYDKVKLLFLQFIFNGDMCFDIIFAIDGFVIVYTFINSRKPLTFERILLEIFIKILESYAFMLVLFFIFWKVLPKSGPLGTYFFESERESCQCQAVYIFFLITNFTFGLYETYYPYCVYHYWFVHLSIQYFVVVLALIYIYKYNKAFFHLVFFLVTLNIFFVQLWNTSISPINQNFYDVLRKNPANIQMQTQKKFITRMGAILIGLIISILYNEKENNFIIKIQKSKLKSMVMFVLGLIIFTFWFLIHYLTINEYVVFSGVFNFFYKLFKREVLVVALFMMVIPLFTSHWFFISLSKGFDNCAFYLFNRVSIGIYLIGSIIARLTFYNYDDQKPESSKISNYFLFWSFFWIIILSCAFSILMTSLFQSPFIKIGIILKKKYYYNNNNTIKD